MKDNAHEIIIIGTAHVSNKSVEEVKYVIERERPQIVAVELCAKRYHALRGDVPEELSIRDILKGGKLYFVLVQWLLAFAQKKIGADVGVKPGAEMLSAIDKAEEIGARIVLVDRDIQITMQRFWCKMTFFEKMRMFFALIGTLLGIGSDGKDKIDLEKVTEEDTVTQLIAELRQLAPNAAKVLVDERDAYIARNLLSVCQDGRVVAVLGAGHRAGVQKFLSAPESIPSPEELTALPKKRVDLAKIIGIMVIAAVIGIFAFLILTGSPSHVILIAFGYWFIINGVLSGAGAAIAGGHPLSILTAFSVAWMTSLNPFLAAGWFAGLVEAWVRNPTSEDIIAITHIETFSDLMKNRLFRIILVAAMANIGSMLGTFIGIWVIFTQTGIQF